MKRLIMALKREQLNLWRQPQMVLQPLFLYILMLILFPLALGSDNQSLANLAPAALWLPLLFAVLLASEQLYQQDYANAVLSQDVLLDDLWLLVLAKILMAWLRLLLPLLLLLPLFALLLHLSWAQLPHLALIMLLGSASLLPIASMGAALTLGQNQQTLLRFLIILPLNVPILIFAVVASRDALLGLNVSGHEALLAALSLFSFLCAIPFTCFGLRSHILP